MTEPTAPPRRTFRLLSMEGLLGAFGLFSLGSGLYYGELMPAFWGTTILTGLFILAAVRRKNWQQHWEEQARRNNAPPPGGDPSSGHHPTDNHQP